MGMIDFEKKREVAYTFIALGILGIIHLKLLAIGLIVTGLLLIDNLYLRITRWVKKNFGKEEKREWVNMDEYGRFRHDKKVKE